VREDLDDLVVAAQFPLLEHLLVVVELLHALPEAEFEALVALVLVPQVLELVNVSATVSHEEFAHIRVEIVVALVVVGSKVDSSCKLLFVVFPSFT
jgi:hypothetical protein